MKAVCIKTYKTNIGFKYKKGNDFNYDYLFDNARQIAVEATGKFGNFTLYLDEPDFLEHFIPIEKLRKEKLIKLNEI